MPEEFVKFQSYIILEHSKTLKRLFLCLKLHRMTFWKTNGVIAPIAAESPEAKKAYFS